MQVLKKKTNLIKMNKVAMKEEVKQTGKRNISYIKSKQIVSELTHIAVFCQDFHLVSQQCKRSWP